LSSKVRRIRIPNLLPALLLWTKILNSLSLPDLEIPEEQEIKKKELDSEYTKYSLNNHYVTKLVTVVIPFSSERLTTGKKMDGLNVENKRKIESTDRRVQKEWTSGGFIFSW